MTIAPIPIIVGALLFIAALVFLKFPPKKINSYYGYRTRRAFHDQQSWDFAQRYSAKFMALVGIWSTLICGIFYLAVRYYDFKVECQVILWIYYALPALGALAMLGITEYKLAKMQKQQKKQDSEQN